jgi:hypothetical protein
MPLVNQAFLTVLLTSSSRSSVLCRKSIADARFSELWSNARQTTLDARATSFNAASTRESVGLGHGTWRTLFFNSCTVSSSTLRICSVSLSAGPLTEGPGTLLLDNKLHRRRSRYSLVSCDYLKRICSRWSGGLELLKCRSAAGSHNNERQGDETHFARG